MIGILEEFWSYLDIFFPDQLTKVLIVLFGFSIIMILAYQRIAEWYSWRFNDFGTCNLCGGKQDNYWFLCCTECYSKRQNEQLNKPKPTLDIQNSNTLEAFS